jgi:hypothetical protein
MNSASGIMEGSSAVFIYCVDIRALKQGITRSAIGIVEGGSAAFVYCLGICTYTEEILDGIC